MTVDARTKAAGEDVAKFTTAYTRLDIASFTVYPWITATGNYDFPTVVRRIRANTAGDVQYKDALGNVVVAKFAAGETRNLIAQSIVVAGTTVTALEGMP